MKQINCIVLVVLLFGSCNNRNTNNSRIINLIDSVETISYQEIDGEKNNDKYDYFKEDGVLIDSKWAALMPYCKIFVSEEFLLKISDRKNSFTGWLYDNLDHQDSKLILFSIFVGGAKRKMVLNPPGGSGDISHTDYAITPQFFTYSFSYRANMFMYDKPSIPNEIKHFHFALDTLVLNLKNDESNVCDVNPSYLVPVDKDTSLKGDSGKVWILNGSQRMIDVSYLKNSINTNLYSIDHSYYCEILERLIQERRGERSKLYFDDIIEVILTPKPAR